MVQPKYSPEEALDRVKLMMGYNSSKTLNENKSDIFKQSNIDTDYYFKTITKSIMNTPSQVKNLNFGSVTVNAKTAAKTIEKSVDGIGTTFEGLEYALLNGFTNIANSMEIIKVYPTVSNESLYRALKGEVFGRNIMNKLVDTVSKQLTNWCNTNPKVNMCIPKTKEELKYGKI
jgi:hypothetical protein